MPDCAEIQDWRHDYGQHVGGGLAALLYCVVADGQQKKVDPAYQAQLEQQWKAHPTMALGSSAPDFTLPGVDGKTHSLSDYKDSRLLVFVFSCNHCPVAQLYEGRIKKLVDDYRSRGVALVAIEADAPSVSAPRELNYSDVEDTMEGMKIRAEYRHFNFPYLYDGDTQEFVEQFGPKVTPHVFVFDQARKLQYEGRIDDNMTETKVTTKDLRNALDALLAGRPVTVAHTPVFGCSLKWKSQVEGKQREAKEWQETPVNLETATAADLKQIRANATDKVVLIHFWATGNSPSMAAFPSLLTTYRWYRSRDFELLTVSTDAPAEKSAVMKFLQDQHAAVRNLQLASADIRALQAAIDPAWKSGVPFTIVLAPGGIVIYRQEGPLNLLALRRAILARLPDGGFPGNSAYWAQR